MKNCKAFCKPEAASHLNEVIQATPLLRLLLPILPLTR